MSGVRFYTAKLEPTTEAVRIDPGNNLGPRAVTVVVGDSLTPAQLTRIMRVLLRRAATDTNLARRTL